MRLTAVIALCVIAGALVALAWRAWDPPAPRHDPAQAQVVQQLRYQNCLLHATVMGSANPTSREQELESDIVDGPLQKQLGRFCKAP